MYFRSVRRTTLGKGKRKSKVWKEFYVGSLRVLYLNCEFHLLTCFPSTSLIAVRPAAGWNCCVGVFRRIKRKNASEIHVEKRKKLFFVLSRQWKMKVKFWLGISSNHECEYEKNFGNMWFMAERVNVNRSWLCMKILHWNLLKLFTFLQEKLDITAEKLFKKIVQKFPLKSWGENFAWKFSRKFIQLQLTRKPPEAFSTKHRDPWHRNLNLNFPLQRNCKKIYNRSKSKEHSKQSDSCEGNEIFSEISLQSCLLRLIVKNCRKSSFHAQLSWVFWWEKRVKSWTVFNLSDSSKEMNEIVVFHVFPTFCTHLHSTKGPK